MNSGLNAICRIIVTAFHSTLGHQLIGILALFALIGPTWGALQIFLARGRSTRVTSSEPPARRLLRISFGLLWILDGYLQTQPSMPLGMVPQVIQPTASNSPIWVQHLDNLLTKVWNFHPIPASTSAVWIQIGIGVWLLGAPRGRWSRIGGLASVGWGLVVWIFGEAFGGIFAPGLTFLSGAPGAALFYCFAGLLIALPERSWSSPHLGRTILRVIGVLFAGAALLQAWPGRGFWQGHRSSHSPAGTLTSMIQQIVRVRQPHLFATWVKDFGTFEAAHGWSVNLFSVIVLALIGAGFLSRQPRVLRAALVTAIVFCLADWVFVEDLGVFGGVGTDPNSMIPLALLFIVGYVALTKLPQDVSVEVPSITATSEIYPDSWRDRLVTNPFYLLRTILALVAVAIVMVGAVPAAVASTNPNADSIVAEAMNGTPNTANFLAPSIRLVDQYGRPVSLASLRGKTIALTGIDDVCADECPLIAQEFHSADTLLGADAKHVEFVAINLNPRFVSPEYLVAFNRQEDLAAVPNWLFLTGSSAQLEKTWQSLGFFSYYLPGGDMLEHSENALVIDATGHVRYVLATSPGPGPAPTKSSLGGPLADAIKRVLPPS